MEEKEITAAASPRRGEAPLGSHALYPGGRHW